MKRRVLEGCDALGDGINASVNTCPNVEEKRDGGGSGRSRQEGDHQDQDERSGASPTVDQHASSYPSLHTATTPHMDEPFNGVDFDVLFNLTQDE